MALNVYAFADEASPLIDGQITAMHRNGLNGLEIRNVDNENISDISADKACEVRKKLDAAGLITWSMGSPIGKIDIEKDDFTAHTEKFKHTLELAEILGAENIRLFSFYIPENKNPADYKNEVIERLGKFCDIAKGTGIDLCHENEKGIYGDNAVRCLDILSALPEIKGIFDPANFVQCGQDTIEAWKMLKPYIKYMHIKDARKDGNVVPSGMGDGFVPEIVREYIAAGGRDFTIEPHLRVFSGFSHLEKPGDDTSIAKESVYATSDEAFDAACGAFRKICGE